jgi:hypothetical protein
MGPGAPAAHTAESMRATSRRLRALTLGPFEAGVSALETDELDADEVSDAACADAGLVHGGSGSASADPVPLDRVAFDALTVGNPSTQVEDFSSFTLGLNASPLTLVNGAATFTASAPNITTGFCTSGLCLAGNQGSGTRILDSFPSGTSALRGLPIPTKQQD